MTITGLPELNPPGPHEFDLDPAQPSWAPEGGYCRCGWIRDARVHAMLPADVLTGDEQLKLPPGCRCGYAHSIADGLWHIVSRSRCPLHAQISIKGRAG